MEEEKPKFAIYFWLTVAACSIMSFSAGINFTWVSPILTKLTTDSTDPAINPIGRPITLIEASWIGSIFAIGGMSGGIAGGCSNELIGRKWTLIINAALAYVLSTAILAFANHVYLYYLGRFFGGFSQGNFMIVMPIYLGEIAEAKIRGAIMTSTNILLAGGSLYSFCIGPYVSPMVYSILTGLWGILFALLFLLAPESPYYLVYKNQHEKAEKALMLLRSHTQSEAKESLKLIEKTIEIDKANKVSVWHICSSKGLRRAFILCFTLRTILQFSGFIAVQTYLSLILEISKSRIDPNISAMVAEGMRIVIGVIVILTIDRCGRRCLLLSSTFGVTLANFSIGYYFTLKENGYNLNNVNWMPSVCLVLFISLLYLGLVPIAVNLPGELFPAPYKSAAGVVFVMQAWLLGFVTSKLFLIMGEAVGFGPVFFSFGTCCVFGFVWLYFFMVETKGKTFLEIQEMLNS